MALQISATKQARSRNPVAQSAGTNHFQFLSQKRSSLPFGFEDGASMGGSVKTCLASLFLAVKIVQRLGPHDMAVRRFDAPFLAVRIVARLADRIVTHA